MVVSIQAAPKRKKRDSLQLIENPYWEEIQKTRKNRKLFRDFLLDDYRERRRLVQKYAWAIPDQEAIEVIASYFPIVEIGAGTGYWAALIRQLGGEICCYDIKPPEQNWFKVSVGYPEHIKDHSNSTLFLCWPPYAEPMATDCLKLYSGKILLYVGEGHWGCTGDDNFHELLEKEFEEIRCVEIPQWSGLHDYLWVYRRKEQS